MALTMKRIGKLRQKVGRHSDGHGLVLQVHPTAAEELVTIRQSTLRRVREAAE